jgi:hypothetical protein
MVFEIKGGGVGTCRSPFSTSTLPSKTRTSCTLTHSDGCGVERYVRFREGEGGVGVPAGAHSQPPPSLPKPAPAAEGRRRGRTDSQLDPAEQRRQHPGHSGVGASVQHLHPTIVLLKALGQPPRSEASVQENFDTRDNL